MRVQETEIANLKPIIIMERLYNTIQQAFQQGLGQVPRYEMDKLTSILMMTNETQK